MLFYVLLQAVALTHARPPCTHDEDDAISRFCVWLKETCGVAEIDNLYVSEFAHGAVHIRGIGVRSNIKKNNSLMCIPWKCVLKRDMTWPLDAKVRENPECDETDHVEKLGIWLARETLLGNSSFFYPYIALLPNEESFRQFHLAYLEGFPWPRGLNVWIRWLRDLRNCHHGMKAPSFQQAKLGYVQVITRHFLDGLIPLVDMVNTGLPQERNVEEDKRDEAFCLVATRDLAEDEEVVISYNWDRKSRLLELQTFGFALDVDKDEDDDDEEPDVSMSSRRAHECEELKRVVARMPQNPGPILQNIRRQTSMLCDRSDSNLNRAASTEL